MSQITNLPKDIFTYMEQNDFLDAEDMRNLALSNRSLHANAQPSANEMYRRRFAQEMPADYAALSQIFNNQANWTQLYQQVKTIRGGPAECQKSLDSATKALSINKKVAALAFAIITPWNSIGKWLGLFGPEEIPEILLGKIDLP